MAKRIFYTQYTNPAAYPPLEHSSRILADLGWLVRFFGITEEGVTILEPLPHGNIEMKLWRFRQPGALQKVHYLLFHLWVIWSVIVWRPKWIYTSDTLACPSAVVLKHFGRCVVYHEHDAPLADSCGSLFQRVILFNRRALARSADLAIVPNEHRAEILVSQTGRTQPTMVVWNCPAREEAKIAPVKSHNEFIIFYHGSLVPSRLPFKLIDALVSTQSTIRFEFAGYETVGHLNFVSQFLEHAAERGISGRVRYLGVIPRRAELLEACRRAHVGLAFMPRVSADLNEQTMLAASNKPFDYLACGLALLVTDLADWVTMFADAGYGRSCNPTDADSIARVLRWFGEHPEETRSMGERGRQRVLKEWNYERQFEKVLTRLEDFP